MKILIFLFSCLFIFSYNVSIAQESETTVFGEAQTPDGKKNIFILNQPNNSSNPLGNPIPSPQENTISSSNTINKTNYPKQSVSYQNNQGNRVVPPSEAQILGSKFQNTLLEADGMVYDIQAYPTKDLNVIGDPANPETIYSPNVNP